MKKIHQERSLGSAWILAFTMEPPLVRSAQENLLTRIDVRLHPETETCRYNTSMKQGTEIHEPLIETLKRSHSAAPRACLVYRTLVFVMECHPPLPPSKLRNLNFPNIMDRGIMPTGNPA